MLAPRGLRTQRLVEHGGTATPTSSTAWPTPASAWPGSTGPAEGRCSPPTNASASRSRLRRFGAFCLSAVRELPQLLLTMEPGCEEYCERESTRSNAKEAWSTSTSASDGTTHRRDSWPVTVDPIKTQPFGDSEPRSATSRSWSSSTTTRPHRCPTRSSRPNLSASRLIHDARRLRPRQVAAAQPAWSAALSGSGSSCRGRCAQQRRSTKPDEATRATTRRPDCSVATACCARLCGGRCGGDPSMACKGSGVQIPSAPPGTTHRTPPL
jgi:hypothetical protein